MQILFLLIPLSLIFVTIAILTFRWAVRARQFEDLDSPSLIPLMDDELQPPKSEHNDTQKQDDETQS